MSVLPTIRPKPEDAGFLTGGSGELEHFSSQIAGVFSACPWSPIHVE